MRGEARGARCGESRAGPAAALAAATGPGRGEGGIVAGVPPFALPGAEVGGETGLGAWPAVAAAPGAGNGGE